MRYVENIQIIEYLSQIPYNKNINPETLNQGGIPIKVCSDCNTANLNTNIHCDKCGNILTPVISNQTGSYVMPPPLPPPTPNTFPFPSAGSSGSTPELSIIRNQIDDYAIGLATVLSIVAPGMGQIFRGFLGKGLTILILSTIGIVILTCFPNFIVGLLVLVGWIMNVVDARAR